MQSDVESTADLVLQETSDVLMVLDVPDSSLESATCTFVNDQFETLFGGSRKEIKDDFSSILDYIHTDSRDKFRRLISNLPADRSIQSKISTNPSVGEERWIEFTVQELGSSAPPGIYLLKGRDATEKVQYQHDLEKLNRRFALLTNNIDQSFLIYDQPNSEVHYKSPDFKKLWGLTEEKLTRQSLLQAVHPSDRPQVESFLMLDDLGQAQDREFRLDRSDDDMSWLQHQIFTIENSRGEILRTVEVTEEITNRKKREEGLARKERMASLGEMSAKILHELKNPTSTINGNLEYLHTVLDQVRETIDLRVLDSSIQNALKEKIDDVLDQTRTNCERIQSVVQDLLQFSRGGSIHPEQGVRLSDVRDLTREIIRDLPRSKQHQLSIQETWANWDTDASLPLSENNFRSILENLLKNAVDATADVKDPSITVNFQNPDKENFELLVCDNGCGIPESKIDRVKKPFFTTKEDSGGTGLGLSIIKTIIENIDGDFEIRSDGSSGTYITIRIPIVHD